MLDDWQQNLAIIIANRTKGDDLVITHLGDCLWKEKNEVCICWLYGFFTFLSQTHYLYYYISICRLQLLIHAIWLLNKILIHTLKVQEYVYLEQTIWDVLAHLQVLKLSRSYKFVHFISFMCVCGCAHACKVHLIFYGLNCSDILFWAPLPLSRTHT